MEPPHGFSCKIPSKMGGFAMAMLVDQSVTCLFSIDITELGREPRTFWKQHYLNQLFCLTLRIHPSRFTFLFGYCILLKKDTSGIPILSSSHPSIPPLTETAKNIQLCFPILRIYLGNVQPKPPR